ncbi:MAG: PQQ-dependent dehydrogenase, methanol/ethanol family [Novosphingobium sp.]|nr:PQQ-dependent dehydrogenase, methanol/ethanol family [Novosphingobium sp.]
MIGIPAHRRVRLAAVLGAAVAGALALASCDGPAQPDEPTALIDPDEWPTFGRTPGEQHYSPLDQIDSGNVGDLQLAWYYDLPSENTATGPIEADGKLFITTGHGYIRAFEAKTGKLLWEFDSKTREASAIHLRLGWGQKGIAYSDGRVFLGTQDGRVIALDADSGEVAWEQRDYPLEELRYINGPPRVFDGKVIVGHGGADVSAIRGFVTAYDAKTGKRLWRFYTVPGNPADGFESKAMELAASTWTGEWWKHGGGGTAWNAFSYDPELGLIYIGVGNGFPYNQALRSPEGGDNLFLASIVAVKAGSGEYVWHYQVCPGDQWDCTAVQDMSLATLEIDGKERKVLMQAPKNGFFYVIDRTTGEFISAEPFAKVTWAEKIDYKTGRPVENPGIRYHGKPGMFELWPGVRGAHSWLPQSYSPKTGLVYIPVIEGASLIGDEGVDFDNQPPIGGMAVNAHPDPDLPGTHRGFLKAWDPVAQKVRWSIELPGNWPGGIMATAGNLVFQGRIDGHLVAYDAKSGKELWSFETQAPVVAPPISYRIDGTQFVTVITGNGAGGGGIFSTGVAEYSTDYRLPRRVLTFALGGKAKLPQAEPALPRQPLDDPDYREDPELTQKGAMVYGMSGCIVCHGFNAVSGGTAPDLRTSPYILDARAFRAAVKEGALLGSGMPPFPEISDDGLVAMRQYLRALSQNLGKKDGHKAPQGPTAAMH